MVRVSVIIPTYNRSDLLKQAIDSVLAQTFSDYEVIVVDDGSTDDTFLVMNAYNDPVRYVKIDHTGLPAAARNKGLQLACGEYIAFLDSDDLWMPGKLRLQVDTMDLDQSIGISCSNAYILTENGVSTQPYFPDSITRKGRLLNDLLIGGNFIITSSAVIRRSLLDSTGSFSEEPMLRAIEDYDLWMKLAAISEIYYSPETLCVYRDIGSGLHNENADRVNQPRMVLILRRLRSFLKAIRYRDLLTMSQIERMINAFSFNMSVEKKNYLAAAFYAICWVPCRAIMITCQIMAKKHQ